MLLSNCSIDMHTAICRPTSVSYLDFWSPRTLQILPINTACACLCRPPSTLYTILNGLGISWKIDGNRKSVCILMLSSLNGSQKVKHAKDSGYRCEKCVSLSSATTTLPWTHGAQLLEVKTLFTPMPGSQSWPTLRISWRCSWVKWKSELLWDCESRKAPRNGIWTSSDCELAIH
jgi:hypothetical protein